MQALTSFGRVCILFLCNRMKESSENRILWNVFDLQLINRTPSVPGPQWLEITPPARVSRISLK